MMDYLKGARNYIGFILLVGALVNGAFKYNGAVGNYIGHVATQVFFGQAFYNYLRGGWVALSIGGFDKSADPNIRATVAWVGLILYVSCFFIVSEVGGRWGGV